MKTRIETIEEFLSTINLEHTEINDYINVNDIEDADELREILQENGAFDVEVIYYSSAIDYLKEHDPSLMDSMELASEMGFDIANLTSETLASLLASEHARDQYDEIEWEIVQFFNELNEMEEA